MNHHTLSRLQQMRQKYVPSLPKILQNLHQINFEKKPLDIVQKDQGKLKEIFPKLFGQMLVKAKEGNLRKAQPHRVGVVLSGGQAPGGHNVIAGLYDALKSLNPKSSLFGFLGGPSGIIEGKFKEITEELLAPYRNQGGFDLIGSGRTKIETEEQLAASLQTVQKNQMDALVVIGGDDSNTNAAILAEYFLSKGCWTTVVGVPKTIDGDLKNGYVATSFGFDTACKIYAELIGNIARDALSAKKYTHFIKLMGRSASHITLECALATHPNIALIGEEIAAEKKTLKQITKEICDVIVSRSKNGKNYGIVLIPEGLIEFIPEIGTLINELNRLTAQKMDLQTVVKQLPSSSADCFRALPEEIQKQLLLDRDPHGNIQVSMIETEKLLMKCVEKELREREIAGSFKGKFSPLGHFFGYEGRAGFPSNFDANYCYALGFVAALLVDERLSGYMCALQDLHRPAAEWKVCAVPLTALFNIEMRKGKEKPVIQKALVELQGKAFSHFKQQRELWAQEDHYLFPGPIQFFGEPELTDSTPITLHLEAIGRV